MATVLSIFVEEMDNSSPFLWNYLDDYILLPDKQAIAREEEALRSPTL